MKKHVKNKSKTTISCILFALIGLSFVLTSAIAGNDYSIKKYVIANGGETSLGNGYKLTGSIAQTVTEKSLGGNYKLSSGFWQPSNQSGESIFKDSFE